MISDHGEYLYVDHGGTGDFALVTVDGDVMPLRAEAKKKILRGEDIAFLMEAARERELAASGSVDWTSRADFSRRVSGVQVQSIADDMANLPEFNDSTSSRGFVSSSLQIGPSGVADGGAEDARAVFGSVASYGTVYPQGTVLAPEALSPIGPLHALRRADIETLFENLKRRVAVIRPLSVSVPTSRFELVRRTVYSDGRIDTSPETVGDEFPGFYLKQWVDRGRLDYNYMPGGGQWPWYYSHVSETGYAGGFFPAAPSGNAISLNDVPPGCSVTPIVELVYHNPVWEWPCGSSPQYAIGDVNGPSECTRHCLAHGTAKTASASGAVSFTWSEIRSVDIPGAAMRRFVTHCYPVDELPTEADFVTPGFPGYSQRYHRQERDSVYYRPWGVAIRLGDHTRWW